jgi:hypothetical protein
VTPTITEPPAYSPSSSFSSSSSSSSSHEDLLNLRPSSSTPPPAYTERAVRKLKITAPPGEGILNASILDAAGRTLYTTSSDAKLKKTSVRRLGPYLDSDTDAHADTVNVVTAEAGEELARFGWDRASPRVRFGPAPDKKEKKKQRKVKCKEWLPLANSNSGATSNLQYVFLFHQQSSILMACLLAPACRSRILALEGARYSITERKGGVGYVRDYLLPLCPLLRCETYCDALPLFSFFASMKSTHFPPFPSRAGVRPRTPNRNI